MPDLIELAGLSIRTEHIYPPIPCREFDWVAYDDDRFDGAEDSHCPAGFGATEAAAIVDLILETMQEWPDRGDKDAAWEYRLNCMAEDCDSSPYTLLPMYLTIRLYSGRPGLAFTIGH